MGQIDPEGAEDLTLTLDEVAELGPGQRGIAKIMIARDELIPETGRRRRPHERQLQVREMMAGPGPEGSGVGRRGDGRHDVTAGPEGMRRRG